MRGPRRSEPLVALALVAAAVSLPACGGTSSGSDGGYEPSGLAEIPGSDVKRVTLTAEGARRVGIRTAPVAVRSAVKVIPHAAVLYEEDGDTFVYTSPERLSYVRAPIEIDRVEGDRALLDDGPPAGTQVVTVGGAELLGSEFEVEH